MHKCTEEDYSEFNEIASSYNKTFEEKKKKNIFYCLNETD